MPVYRVIAADLVFEDGHETAERRDWIADLFAHNICVYSTLETNIWVYKKI